jgi:hypothetical protein
VAVAFTGERPTAQGAGGIDPRGTGLRAGLFLSAAQIIAQRLGEALVAARLCSGFVSGRARQIFHPAMQLRTGAAVKRGLSRELQTQMS